MFRIIGSLLDSIIPFGIFLYLTLLLFGVVRLKSKPKILENPPTHYKISAIIGTICFGLLIVFKIIEL